MKIYLYWAGMSAVIFERIVNCMEKMELHTHLKHNGNKVNKTSYAARRSYGQKLVIE